MSCKSGVAEVAEEFISARLSSTDFQQLLTRSIGGGQETGPFEPTSEVQTEGGSWWMLGTQNAIGFPGFSSLRDQKLYAAGGRAGNSSCPRGSKWSVDRGLKTLLFSLDRAVCYSFRQTKMCSLITAWKAFDNIEHPFMIKTQQTTTFSVW